MRAGFWRWRWFRFPSSHRVGVGAGLLSLGLALIILALMQSSSREYVVNVYPSPILEGDELRVFVGDGPPHLVGAFEEAVEVWADAVDTHNRFEAVLCPIRSALGACGACAPPLPRPVIAERNPDALILFRDDMPAPNAVAATGFRELGGEAVAVVEVWSGIPEHRAFQVAVHELSRLYGVDIPELVETWRGVIAAGSSTRELHPSVEEFLNGGPDPILPTSIDLYAAAAAKKMLTKGLREEAQLTVPVGFPLRSYNEPDLKTLSLIASPAAILAGIYLVQGRRRPQMNPSSFREMGRRSAINVAQSPANNPTIQRSILSNLSFISLRRSPTPASKWFSLLSICSRIPSTLAKRSAKSSGIPGEMGGWRWEREGGV